jgi:hypothetical protein
MISPRKRISRQLAAKFFGLKVFELRASTATFMIWGTTNWVRSTTIMQMIPTRIL